MWKKLTLLITVASAVSQVVRYWHDAGNRAAERRKRHARNEVARWEEEGGNLPPAPLKGKPVDQTQPAGQAAKAPQHQPSRGATRARTRAGSGSASRAGRASSATASA